MYEVTAIETGDGDLRAGRPFPLSVRLNCRGGGCPPADLTIAVDGDPVAMTEVALESGDEMTVAPTVDGEPEAAETVVHEPGRHTIEVTVGGVHITRTVVVGPPVTPVDHGIGQVE